VYNYESKNILECVHMQSMGSDYSESSRRPGQHVCEAANRSIHIHGLTGVKGARTFCGFDRLWHRGTRSQDHGTQLQDIRGRGCREV
jgi:hypothetical protein